MSDFSEIRKGMSKAQNLEDQLNLKQLQVNRLLTITQAINDNISAQDLYKMYNSFMEWEMGIKRMALYILDNDSKAWTCISSIGLTQTLTNIDISDRLPKYNRLKNLEDDKDHPLFKQFDLIIPVLHKEIPITYAFIGGFDKDEDMYDKVKFITSLTNIIAVAIENKRLFKRQIEQERLKREMELAGDMQQMLVPSNLPKTSAYEFSSIYKPHLGVGGDYFDFVEINEDSVVFCVADISGKGMAAALLMANFQASFHSLVLKIDTLDQFVKDLNQSLIRITKGERFLTLLVAEYNKKTGKLTYVNSGHNPPFLALANEIVLLDKGSTILGSFDQLPEVEVGEININQEAMLLIYTDGLTDVQNDEGAYLNEDIVSDFVLKNAALSTDEFNVKLTELIMSFKENQAFPDDLTILTCKIF